MSEAFGKTLLNNSNQITMNLRFQGQYFDEETGPYQNYFRDYNRATGRYVQGNPLGYLDPWGLLSKAECRNLEVEILNKSLFHSEMTKNYASLLEGNPIYMSKYKVVATPEGYRSGDFGKNSSTYINSVNLMESDTSFNNISRSVNLMAGASAFILGHWGNSLTIGIIITERLRLSYVVNEMKKSYKSNCNCE